MDHPKQIKIFRFIKLLFLIFLNLSSICFNQKAILSIDPSVIRFKDENLSEQQVDRHHHHEKKCSASSGDCSECFFNNNLYYKNEVSYDLAIMKRSFPPLLAEITYKVHFYKEFRRPPIS